MNWVTGIIRFSDVEGLTTCIAPPGDPFLSLPSSRSNTTQNQPNLQILDPLYDLTPPSSITAVVTEAGVIPPDSISSIPLALGRLI
jgi:translation initiation factor eIF-2B subunit delta